MLTSPIIGGGVAAAAAVATASSVQRISLSMKTSRVPSTVLGEQSRVYRSVINGKLDPVAAYKDYR